MSIYHILKNPEKGEMEEGYLIEGICAMKKGERDYLWRKDFEGLAGPLLNDYSDHCLKGKDKKGKVLPPEGD